MSNTLPSREQALVMGIDSGTEGIRAVLCDLQGREVASASCGYPTSFPAPGWAEQRPEDWWRALVASVRGACEKLGPDAGARVVGLCLDGTCSTVVAAKEDGTPLADAILWMDTRAHREVEIIRQTHHPVLKYSGGEDAVGWMVPKALWLKRERPELYARAEKLVESLDWMTFRLTGEWTASMCNATDAWNYATPMGGWPEDFFRQLGLEDVLEKWPQRVLFMGDLAGRLTEEAAAQLGLRPGTPVAEGGIDAHMGMLGMGIAEPGVMGVTIGSSTVHLVFSPEEKCVDGIWGPYPEIILRKQWLLQGGQNSTGSVVRWFKDHLAAQSQLEAARTGDSLYAILDRKAASVPPGSEGVTVLEYWQGNRSPWSDPLATGAIWGLTLSHREEHVFRAVMEGAAFGTRLILERLRESGVEVRELRACGGGIKSALWLQIHADVCGLPIAVAPTAECAALGGAMCAAVAAGYYPTVEAAVGAMSSVARRVEPDMQTHALYEAPYRRYLDTYKALAPLMHESRRERSADTM